MTDSRSRFEAHLDIPDMMREQENGAYVVPFVQRYWQFWQAAEAETAQRCVELCEKAEIQTVAAKGRDTAARLKVAIKAEFPEAFK